MAKAKKSNIVAPGANLERVRADQARRRSGAAGAHESKPRGTRTRKGARQAAIRDNARSW